MSVEWNRIEAAWWPAIADALEKPWPEEAALFDIRWHAVRAHAEQTKMPGWSYFIERWGYPTQWSVRKLLRSDAWHDPIGAEFRPRSAHAPPTVRPPETEQPGPSAEFRPRSAHAPPTVRHRADPSPQGQNDRSIAFEDTPTEVDHPNPQPYQVHGGRQPTVEESTVVELVAIEVDWAERRGEYVSPAKVARTRELIRAKLEDDWTADELKAWREQCDSDGIRVLAWPFLLGPVLARQREAFRERWASPRSTLYDLPHQPGPQDPGYREAILAALAEERAKAAK